MNLLVTGAWSEAEENIDSLEKMGHTVYFMKWETDKLPVSPSIIDGVICNGLFLNHNIEAFTALKYIQLTSAGFDRVPMDYVKSHNIKIYNARGVYSIPMAEFALCGVLQLYKKSNFFANNQIQHRWEKDRNLLELYDKNVCIVGCGSVGTECAKRFKAFGTYITGIDIVPYSSQHYDEILSLDNIEQALKTADIVILTLPLTDETRNLFNDNTFSIMKKNSILVNISRGGVVNTNALINALKTKLYGAVLDVFDTEPLCDESILWDMENVIITPHNSFVGDGVLSRLYTLFLKNIETYTK